MKKYLVQETTLLEILKYLATRPYTEVYKLVPLLQTPNVELDVEEVNGNVPEEVRDVSSAV